MKLFLALFATMLTAGCTVAPVQYVPVSGTNQIVQVCSAMGCKYVYASQVAPTTDQTPVVAVPSAVYVQQPLYVSPIFEVAAGVILLRGLIMGGHYGHRRGR